MKQMIYKLFVVIALMVVVNIGVVAQTYYLNNPQDTISITGSQYTENLIMVWHINSSTNTKPLNINYEVDVENHYDLIYVYAIDSDGSSFLILKLTGQMSGTISTVLPTGKAKIEFRTDGSISGSTYDGFTISYSPDNSAGDYTISNKILAKNGIGIGTGIGPDNGLYIYSPKTQYGIKSTISSTNRNSYGLYSTATNSNSSANLYGLYSSVSGITNKKWAGFFTGGDVEITDGNLKMTGDALISGSVGVGTSDPQYKLDVNGTIRANEIIVNTLGADFVFDSNYRLISLSELHLFIEENKHLPDIVPASVMAHEGVNLSELNIKLLQKIEELTLYLIKQQQSIEELKLKIDKMERKEE